MNEKKKILRYRIIGLSILLAFILIPTIVIACEPEPKLINSECYENGYNYEVKLTFNREVDYGGEAEVAFYDINGNLIGIENLYFFESGKVVTGIAFLYEEVDSYEIVSIDFDNPFNFITIMYYFVPVVLIGFVLTLCVRYKEYDFNGKTISVYAGVNKHYLKIDDEKFDEHNSWLIFSPLKLSTKLGENEIIATISLTNNISLKINDKLYQPKKTD